MTFVFNPISRKDLFKSLLERQVSDILSSIWNFQVKLRLIDEMNVMYALQLPHLVVDST